MKSAALLMLLMISFPVLADDTWSSGDGVRELTFASLLLVDCSQTLWMVGHPPDPRRPPPLWGDESNIVLGPHPNRLTVVSYTTGALAAHFTIALLLPRPYREIWQVTWIGVETAVVGMNYSAGLRLSF
jgi:hypothetical protein